MFLDVRLDFTVTEDHYVLTHDIFASIFCCEDWWWHPLWTLNILHHPKHLELAIIKRLCICNNVQDNMEPMLDKMMNYHLFKKRSNVLKKRISVPNEGDKMCEICTENFSVKTRGQKLCTCAGNVCVKCAKRIILECDKKCPICRRDYDTKYVLQRSECANHKQAQHETPIMKSKKPNKTKNKLGMPKKRTQQKQQFPTPSFIKKIDAEMRWSSSAKTTPEGAKFGRTCKNYETWKILLEKYETIARDFIENLKKEVQLYMMEEKQRSFCQQMHLAVMKARYEVQEECKQQGSFDALVHDGSFFQYFHEIKQPTLTYEALRAARHLLKTHEDEFTKTKIWLGIRRLEVNCIRGILENMHEKHPELPSALVVMTKQLETFKKFNPCQKYNSPAKMQGGQKTQRLQKNGQGLWKR